MKKAKALRSEANKIERIATQQKKLDERLGRIGSKLPRRKGPSNVIKFRAAHGAVAKRILDLLATKTLTITEMWDKIANEKVTTNKLAMARAVYTLGKKGLLESPEVGKWRKTVEPTHEELHGKKA
jgi:hypothetical protein